MLAKGDRQLGGRPVGHEDRVTGVLPALVVVAVRRAGPVLLEAVTVDVPVAVDPLERPLDVGTDRGEFVGVAVPAPGERGDEHVERRRVVRPVIRGVRDEVERGELAVADLVLDLARLHVAVVVVRVGLERGERAQAAEREARRDGEGLERDGEGVASEQRDEPGDPGGGNPGVRVVVGRGGGQFVVAVQTQRREILDGLAERGRDVRVRGLEDRRLADPAPAIRFAGGVGGEELVAGTDDSALFAVDHGGPPQTEVPGALRFERQTEEQPAVRELRG